MRRVLCWGSFDILHKGHVEFLKDAKKQGDFLIVIVVPDRAIFENKGRLPINNQKERAGSLKKLKIADQIIATGGDFNLTLKLIERINPSVFVLGYDQQTKIEDELKKYLKSKNILPKFYHSKKIAKGEQLLII